MIEYKVTAGSLLLGITSSYAEALEWARTHDRLVRNGPFAKIKELRL